jgi:hypothetical protein
MRTNPKRQALDRRDHERGVALVFATFALAALLVAIASALVTGSSNARASYNYRVAAQAHFVAESGLSDALQNINGTGVINYNNEIVNTWGTRFGSTAKTFAPISGFTYTVATSAGPDLAEQGRLVATATQVDSNNVVVATNTVVANLKRSDNPSTAPGAIYLADDAATDASFNGNSFTVDGNDHNYTGGNGPGASVPGISTRNSTNTDEAIGSLSGVELDNVQGYGYQAGPPIVPSISTSPSAPTVAQINQFITDIQNLPGATTCSCTQVNNSCPCSFGSPNATPPVCTITTFGANSNVQIKNNGNVDGCGVMIVQGNLDVQGNISFKGMILVKGTLSVTGSALVYGTVWAEGVDLNVGGNAQVYYSTQALTLANNVVPAGTVMSPMNVVSIADCADLGSGVNGCP